MTTEDLIAYYVALLIIQYATQPNAVATITALITMLVQNQIITQVENGFKFTVLPVGQPSDGAVGVQLEQIAQYRGASRVVYGLPPNLFFQFVDAADTPYDGNGFMDALDSPAVITWIFLTAEGTEQPLYSLTDDQLYRLTQFRAAVQSCDMSLESIDAILETFFGNNVALLDNENMTIFYVDLNSDSDTLFGIAAITNSFPRPAGVLLQTFRADMLTNFFGLQDAETGYDASFAGFSDAETALTTGTFLSAP
jgi:Protein of unknown function (DUF2612)